MMWAPRAGHVWRIQGSVLKTTIEETINIECHEYIGKTIRMKSDFGKVELFLQQS